MSRLHLFASAASVALLTGMHSALSQTTASLSGAVETVTVTAERLDHARDTIQTQIGASTYTFDSKAIESQPGGDNNPMNQVILQAPGVVQDSYGQLHIRAEHNALQYRLNGVILPEGISVFSQTLDPRLAGSVQLITGALPAEYGLVTGGIVDVHTKSGLFDSGGTVSMYGGSHDEIEPSASYGGSAGKWNYFVTGDYLEDNPGIESPDGSANPLHDHTSQYHGFGYAEDILDDDSRLAMVVGTSHDQFQIPDLFGQSPSFTVSGSPVVPSQNLNDDQREITQFGTVSYLEAKGKFNYQVSAFARVSSLQFSPDPNLGDLEYTGISQRAYKRDVGYGVQAEGEYDLGVAHTLRGGILVEADNLESRTTAEVLPIDSGGNVGTTPVTIPDNGAKDAQSYSAYLQDEWKILEDLTVNYGLRWDYFKAYSSGSQISPRVNAVWQPLDGTTLHIGYARYYSPPPFELVGTESILKFVNTTAAPLNTADTTPVAERANYFDAGAQQKFGNILEGDDALTLGVDSFFKKSINLIDEGQFGAPIILTPFNYKHGIQYGVEYSATYDAGPLSAYGNLSFEHAMGKDIFTSQFEFDPGDLAHISDHYIHLDHEQSMTASAGLSYLFSTATRVSADMLYGAGLRADYTSPGGASVPNGAHVPYYLQVNTGVSQDFSRWGINGFSARFDVINLFDKKYEIRNGTGVGVGAPQWGPRRGFFAGLTETF
jgi:outer membrane receptor for ferrienterochelin and colicins